MLTKYINELAKQENEPLLNHRGLVFPNPAPEDNGGYDIGFGHKLNSYTTRVYGIPVKSGITLSEAKRILMVDVLMHMGTTEVFCEKVRKWRRSEWRRLEMEGKILLTDYSFNGALAYFPSFTEAVRRRDFEGMLREYKRYYTRNGTKREISRRNEWTCGMIKDWENK